MWLKTVLLAVIIITSFVHIMVNNPDERLKRIVWQPVLSYYAAQINYTEHIDLIYTPGIRKLAIPKEDVVVKAVIPNNDNNYEQIVNKVLQTKGFALTQCSAMDSWHTSNKGQSYLKKMYRKGYRAVVFDGGHHLPTLGLVPDIIIVPQMAGYTLHSYMRDGMKIARLVALAEELKLPTTIAVLPRWAVIKHEKALENITQEILINNTYKTAPAQEINITADTRMSKYNNTILIYINNRYYKEPLLLLKSIKGLGTDDVKKIYLAFDYNNINKQEAKVFVAWLKKELAIEVEMVNEPVNFFNVFWGGI